MKFLEFPSRGKVPVAASCVLHGASNSDPVYVGQHSLRGSGVTHLPINFAARHRSQCSILLIGVFAGGV